MDVVASGVWPVPSVAVRRRMYERMAVMKAVDDRVVRGVMSGEFGAVYFPHRGQEGVAASLGVALRGSDRLVTTYRGVHDHLGKGVSVVELFAELTGRGVAPGRGKAGTMHVASPECGVMFATGIVGAGLPVAVGLGIAAQLDGGDRVVAVCFGDGAVNTGSFHEAVNLAAVGGLPVVFVCQNNLFGEKTPVEATARVARVADRAAAYGIPGVRVDGNDPDQAFGALSEAVERARGGGGPTLVECVTFRFRGHSMGDSSFYIPKVLMEAARVRDPLPVYRGRLLSSGVCSEEELAGVDAGALEVVDGAVRVILEASYPTPDSLMEHVYGNAEKAPA